MRVILQHSGEGYWIKYDNGVTGYRVGNYLENPELEEWIAEGNITESEFSPEQLVAISHADIKKQYKELAIRPIEINGITFNGGDSSAAAINGSIQLDELAGKTETMIWDVDNVNHTFTIEEAKNIAATIGKAYRDIMYQRNDELNTIK